jgi:cyclin-dependent kinase 10
MPQVVTLWYRAPEVLLGCESYGAAVDMWACGCVMAELLRNQPLFPARSEVECLAMMCKTLGSPTPKIWPVGVRSRLLATACAAQAGLPCRRCAAG